VVVCGGVLVLCLCVTCFSSSQELALHRFANYAVQVALRQCSEPQREQMLSTLLPRLLSISTSKHGSNVAEVVLSLTSPARIEKVTLLFKPIYIWYN